VAARFPKGRKKGLFVQNLPQQTIIFDPRGLEGYCLGKIAAAVLARADGKTAPATIAERVTAELGMDVTEAVVNTTLTNLQRAGLLLPNAPKPARGITRRSLVGKLAAAVAVTILIAPARAFPVST
jgi:hypothetical protein